MTRLYGLISRCLFWLTAIGIVIMALSQLFGRYSWQLELFSHYVPHLAILTMLATVFYPKFDLNVKGIRAIRWVFLSLGLWLIGWSLQPLSLLFSKPVELANVNSKIDSKVEAPSRTSLSKATLNHTISSKPLIISYQNVNIANQYPKHTIKQLTDFKVSSSSHAQPDIIALVEAGGAQWQSMLSILTKHYPAHCGVDKDSPFALQVFSKDDAAQCDIIMLSGFPVARLVFADPSFNPHHAQSRVLYVAHPPPPLGRTFAVARNNYLNQLANLIKADQEQSVMLVGDFNLSAFSPIYRDFISQTQPSSGSIDKRFNEAFNETFNGAFNGALKETISKNINKTSFKATSLQRTTLTGLPTWRPFGIGIDHVLVNFNKDDVTTHAIDWIGSDHRGLIIEWRE